MIATVILQLGSVPETRKGLHSYTCPLIFIACNHVSNESKYFPESEMAAGFPDKKLEKHQFPKKFRGIDWRQK